MTPKLAWREILGQKLAESWLRLEIKYDVNIKLFGVGLNVEMRKSLDIKI